MRQLRHHEQRLLKKVDFLQWKNEHNLRELQVGLSWQHTGRWTSPRALPAPSSSQCRA